MVFPHHRAILGFDAFLRNAGPHDFRQAVDIDRVYAAAPLDVAAHLVGPGLGPENPDFQGAGTRVPALAIHLFENIAEVRRGHNAHLGPEIVDKTTLFHTGRTHVLP